MFLYVTKEQQGRSPGNYNLLIAVGFAVNYRHILIMLAPKL